MDWKHKNGTYNVDSAFPRFDPSRLFLRDGLKNMVYTNQPLDLNDLKNKIRQACHNITANMIEHRVQDS